MSEKTYRIGEAAAKLSLKTYVLRFWEMEFPQIAPLRTEKGQRLYTESDLALLGRIRYLLHERGLTIEGARRLLREEAARGVSYADANARCADDLPDDVADDLSDEDFDDEEETDGAAIVAQAPLFPEGPEISGRENTQIADIAAELRAIRHLLTF